MTAHASEISKINQLSKEINRKKVELTQGELQEMHQRILATISYYDEYNAIVKRVKKKKGEDALALSKVDRRYKKKCGKKLKKFETAVSPIRSEILKKE